ncbi:MAG: helicase C-terminal domain-containing protein [Candidatus Gracilibacteria bacterium]|nr:helicase C-terminal domain-containing protein [Candidatus Gracilibacteria bacterium]
MPFIVLDLETTGLNAQSDSIIEVALLRIDASGNTLDSWSSLVHPGFVIHEDITFLTSITPEDLADAPKFSEVRDTIVKFVGKDPIMGHNVGFDIAFLAANGIRFETEKIVDTFRIAEFLFHTSKSLNLTSITEELGYTHENAHRAYADVQATAFLWSKIVEKVTRFSPLEQDILHTISQKTYADWTLGYLDELSDAPESPGLKVHTLDRLGKGRIFDFQLPKKVPSWQDILASATTIEERPEQKKMMASVELAFEDKAHLCIEAPTGIGKTFAYLIPGLLTATSKGKQLFVSTNTKTLQDQIENKDIPQLRELLKPHGIEGFRVQKLKGRSNYLSLLKFFEWYDKEAFTSDEAIFTLKVAYWLMQTHTGELDEFSLYNGEYGFIEEIHAGDIRVLSPDNHYKDFEFIVRARDGVKEAQIVILNHALLLGEYLDEAGGAILPKIEYLVLDEVHNLEAVATESLKKKSDLEGLSNRLQNLEKIIKRYNKSHLQDPFIYPELQRDIDGIILNVGMFFESCENHFEVSMFQKKDAYAANRAQDILVENELFTSKTFDELTQLYDGLNIRVHELEQILFQSPKGLVEELETERLFITGFLEHIKEFLYERENPLIRIFSKRDNFGAKLYSTPLEIGSILKKRLWDVVPSIVVTSATLTIGSEFTYISKILALQDFTFEKLQTDFNYAKQALLYIPLELGDVRKYEQKRAYEQFLTKLLKIVGGRTLMLFTSFASIKETTLALAPELKSTGIQLLTQGMSGGKHKLIHEFRKYADTSVLLGTDSFWEGIDFPGNTLETLVIHKFPFAVPTDPIFVARSRLFADPFMEYSLPVMILKLKQGIGRLIRTKTDTGIIVLLDKRITTDWGDIIRASLPEGLPVKMSNTDTFLQILTQSRAKVAIEKKAG